jgi:UDP-N-acetylglucosamine 2-epimerase (non-hydrolysing)
MTSKGIETLEPLGYWQFLNLVKHAKLVLTDSGGIQEETTYLGIPCLTLRAQTERPVTVKVGTNFVVGTDIQKIGLLVDDILTKKRIAKAKIPPYWDGKTAQRIVKILLGTKK